MLDTTAAELAAAELLRQHTARQPFAGLASPWALADPADAYRVQDAYVARLLGVRNTTLRGYKIALTTPAMREMVGFHDSVSGRLLADQIVPSGHVLAARDYVRLIVEFEIAFEMARDLPASAQPWTGTSILAHVACAYPAIEIADDRCADYATLNRAILTLAADNAWNQGLALGAPVRGLGYDMLRDVVGIALLDGHEVGRGSGRDVLGHPLGALAWLANHVQDRGLSLRRGDIVTTGSLVKSQFPHSGAQIRFVLPDFGEVSLSVA